MKRRARYLTLGGTTLASLSLLAVTIPAASANVAQKPVGTMSPPIHIKNGATSSYQSGFTPAQIRHAYGVDQLSANGSGQTIAIVDAYGSPTIQSDIQTFDSQFGLAAPNLTIAYPSGTSKQSNSGWALETSLDVEWAHALAPAANIMLVVAKSASTTDLLAAEDYASAHGAQVVSNSWGGSETSTESQYDTHFQHAGVVYTASAGDSGSSLEWPAASSYVLAVGGTSLSLSATGGYGSESAWSSSGGGQSAYISTPSYQSNWTSVVGTKRGIPDIGWVADPNTGVAVYDSTADQGQKGWFVVGGTSVGAPSWAAMVALADQGRTSKLASFDAITQLYNTAGSTGSSGYATNFHDVTTGSNGHPALPGYDLVTGIGSPQANALIPALTSAP